MEYQAIVMKGSREERITKHHGRKEVEITVNWGDFKHCKGGEEKNEDDNLEVPVEEEEGDPDQANPRNKASLEYSIL